MKVKFRRTLYTETVPCKFLCPVYLDKISYDIFYEKATSIYIINKYSLGQAGSPIRNI